MQFVNKEDIEAPIDFVFARVTDFAGFERSALRRGADVQRLDTLSRPGIGMSWAITFGYRGKPRTVEAKVVSFDPPNGLILDATSAGLDGVCTVDLVPLSRLRTRLSLTLEVKARTLPARILLQTLKVARGSVVRKIRNRLTDFAEATEDRYRKSA